MKKITPFLWYDADAEEAARFYTSLFPHSKIDQITHYGEGGPGPKGSVMTVKFQLNGQDFIALNGGPHFRFNEAISLTVPCESQEEIDEYWEKLSEGGAESQCGWLKDRYGLSWQIVPAKMGEWMDEKDPERAKRVFQALMQMKKIDMNELKAIHEGASTRG